MVSSDLRGRKILFIYDYNLFFDSFGTKKRFYTVLQQLRERGYLVHQAAPGFLTRELLHEEKRWDSNLIEKRFLLNRHAVKEVIINRGKAVLKVLLPRFCVDILKGLTGPPKETRDEIIAADIFNGGNHKVRQRLEALMGREGYDYILASCCNYASLLKNIGMAKKVLLVEDVISTQTIEQNANPPSYEELFKKEVEAISKFDDVFCISPDELQLFSSRTVGPRFHYLPPFMEKGCLTPVTETYDFLFIGFVNEHNRTALTWLFEKVMPRLPGFSLVVVGRVGEFFEFSVDLPRVTFIPYCDDLPLLYSQCRVALSPMFSGTGVKIKIVEALSYGRPVVATEKGVIGMPGDFRGKGVLVENDVEKFAAAARCLCEDPGYYEAVSRRATLYFDTYFSEKCAHAALDRVFPPLAN